jgi:hypothetical protein
MAPCSAKDNHHRSSTTYRHCKNQNVIQQLTIRQKDKREVLSSDTCVIRTHAPEGIALAGQRVNHSAKVPVELMML